MTDDASRFLMGHVIRGTTEEGLDETLAYRLGRGLGTLVRRRCAGAHDVAVARADASAEAARVHAGLVRGLILTGHRVLDGGLLDLESARHLVEGTGAGAFISRSEDALAIHPFVGAGDTVATDADPRPAREVCTLADGGEWSAFEGSLEVLSAEDVRAATPRVGVMGR